MLYNAHVTFFLECCVKTEYIMSGIRPTGLPQPKSGTSQSKWMTVLILYGVDHLQLVVFEMHFLQN